MLMLLFSKNNSKILVFSFNEYLVIIIQTNFLMYPSYFKIINLIKPNQLQDKEN